MKKIFAVLMSLVLGGSLCACGNGVQTLGENTGKESSGSSVSEEQVVAGGIMKKQSTQEQSSKGQAVEGLQILNDSDHLANCYTKDGYYYLTEDATELEDGTWGTHLMYMDFATKQEVYLCSNAGCKHNTADCPSVFLMNEFPLYASGIFVYGDKLYVLSKESDNEGSVTQDLVVSSDDAAVETEAAKAVLYEMNLDGTNRQKVFTFDVGLTVEDVVLGDESGLYFVTKKLSNTMGEGNNSVTTSTDRKLVFWNKSTQKAEDICSLNFEDGINWKIIGCMDNALVLSGTDYGKALTTDDYTKSDDDWNNMYKNSSEVVATLDLNTKTLDEKYRMDNATLHSIAVMDGTLYVSNSETGEIKTINLTTKEEKVLCTLAQNYIMNTFDHVLCCDTWNDENDRTYYFVNTDTGEVQHSSLVNQALGWNLKFKAEVGSQILVIYDYEYTPLGDNSYDITQYKYALIDKSDLYAENAKYEPILMVGKGC